ncbi:sodium- and chloride-dependent glycine transporter 1-like [Mercenaria mercenaria]|uniref:sodium- and chloride-dependent glycine transporter 1-like n=1 Tax=Mercenaria mercenaria TaxID=6596 RepID=UPI00234FAB7F|nr:sodium- and chloride-dependent glycine transporter 1-like [Mercenaria mercenaria]
MGKQIIERETWDKKLDFILSCVGYAVGLGNIWRFPYLCYRNGGGAFLVPYVIMLAIAGAPIFFFELALGQFASEGPITVWKVNPFFGGIGWGMVTISGLVCVYYNVIIMYAIYYMFVSFVNLDGEVPWIDCDNPWNTPNCRAEAYPDFASMTNNNTKVDELVKMMNHTCVNKTLAGMSATWTTLYDYGYEVVKANFSDCNLDLKLPSDEYWTRFVLRLHEADGIDHINGVSLKNVICLFFAWILIFFCLMKGIKSSGKVVYFTATFPYVLLTVLLVRGLTLEGHKEGIEFYIIPEWSKLKDPKVWSDAATQIFYSLGPAFGSLLTMSSFNKFRNNCWRDSVIVALINCGTSVFGGFVIFSVLGYMAHQTNQAVADVADSGPGLAFVAYPEGIARLPVSSLWAFLFFFMILTLGLDSQMVMMETVISGITDVFPQVLRRKKALFTFICCMIGFVLGIPMTTKGGIFVLTLFDWYAGSYNLMIVCLCELIAVCWLYGIKNFMKDIEMMIGKRPMIFWAYYVPTWFLITPVAIVFIVIMSGINYTPVYYYADQPFPSWAQALGWILACLPLLWITIGAIVALVRNGCRIGDAIKPRPDWGPRLKKDRQGRYFGDNYGYVADGYEKEIPRIYAVDYNIKATENGKKTAEYREFDRL